MAGNRKFQAFLEERAREGRPRSMSYLKNTKAYSDGLNGCVCVRARAGLELAIRS